MLIDEKEEKEMLNWFWKKAKEAKANPPDVYDFLIFFSYQPNVGAGTNEPSVQELIYKYYATYFDTEKAEQLTALYVKELTNALAKKASS